MYTLEWSKIKNVLIILILITNVILISILLNERFSFRDENVNHLELIIEFLDQKNITVELESFAFPDRLESVYVESIFLNEGYVTWRNPYYRGTLPLWDIAQRPVYFKDLSGSSAESEPLKVVKNFIASHDLDVNYEYYGHYSYSNADIMVMSQFYNGIPLDESKAFFWVENGAVQGYFLNSPFKILSTGDIKYDIMPLEYALYLLLNVFQPGDVIESIYLVYKLNDESLLIEDLVSGEMTPFYRLTLKDGRVFYKQAVH